jgi:molybdopterin converting factor small subunit
LVVEIHLHTVLQRPSENKMIRQISLTLPPGATLADVISELDIKYSDDGLLLVINGRLVDKESSLEDGDIIHLIPALSGG